ncbi:galactose mutarotase [Caballeronia megalochromosomata]|nr:galactose mutarotase [Caballeronia megalochromosomata]
MTITRENFGSFEGKDVHAYTLINASGCKARLITFGARLVEMHAPDKQGRLADIVLGFDNLDRYITTDTYFGATCGRYGNRIREASFALDDQVIQVTGNEAGNHLHGGVRGFDKYVWEAYPNEEENSITFTHLSRSGDEGFPGELLLKAKYVLTDDNRLLITMSGITDAPTILNMVHHSYWNVAGHDSGSLFGQSLKVEADYYTPVDAELLATGEIQSVAGTPFDFREQKRIGQDVRGVENAGAGRLTEEGGGYDHNWVLRSFGPGLNPVATLWDQESGRGIHLKSTEPGVQIYTGGYINASVIGKGDKPYCPYAGVTFETQKFPGSPNLAHFSSSRLNPGEVYTHQMEVQFFAR